MNQYIRIFGILLLAFIHAACQSTPRKITPQLFKGHFTTGIAYEFFTPENSNDHYFINLPEDVRAYLYKQPRHKIGNESFATIYVEVEGVVIPYNPEFNQISVTRVLSMGPPHADYLKRSRP